MFCMKCGADCTNDKQYCHNCGAMLPQQNVFPSNPQVMAEGAVQKPKKKKSRWWIPVLIILLVFALFTGVAFFVVNSIKNKISNAIAGAKEAMPFLEYMGELLDEDESDNDVNTDVEEASSEKLAKAYYAGEIDADTYVKQMLYLVYDDSMLDEKYFSNSEKANCCEIESLVEEHLDELSEETKEYFIEHATLSNVTFIEGKENASVSDWNDPFCETVFAKEKVVNLDHVLVSSGQKFVVWYTTTGESAIDEEKAKAVAEGLEETIAAYDSIWGYEYSFETNWTCKGSTYQSQKTMLENNSYDSSLLENAMQVYVLDTGDSEIFATYFGGSGALRELLNSWAGGDSNGAVMMPYILMGANAFSDMESLQQIYNHELFHHYQYQVMKENKKIEDPYIIEATANLASALASNMATESFLNRWAETYIRHCNDLTSVLEDTYGKTTASYAHFVILDAYRNCVNDGGVKIRDSIYEEDAYAYLMEQATEEELNAITEYLAYKILAQDYENQNLIAAHTQSDRVPMTIIEKTTSYQGESQAKLTYSYYDLGEAANLWEIEATADSDTEYLYAYFIAETNGNYELVEKGQLTNEGVVFETKEFGDYDKLYLAIANGSWTESYDYSLNITEQEVEVTYVPNDVEFETGIDNYNVTITTTLALLEDEELETTTVSTGVVDQLHQKEYLSSTTSVMGMDVDYEIYTDYAKGISYTEIPFTGTWEQDDSGAQTVDITTILDKIKNEDELEKVSENCYRMTFSAEDLKGSLNTAGSDNSYKLGSGEVTALVYVKDGYITKMEYDFAELLSGIRKFDVVIEFSNYNNAGDVNIPESITQ
ncbi:MAG: hypothetical protein ACI4ES_03625 [Roseburia sp.]